MSAVEIQSHAVHQHNKKNKDTAHLEKCVEEQLGDLVDKVECMKIVNNGGLMTSSGESPEKTIKHPLQRPIITVTTVEDFWSLYNHIEVASRLPPGSDYSLFKEGIFPDWEDQRNQKGGRWIINLDRKRREELLDTYWLEILFFLIGEHADQNAQQVNGAVVNVRQKGDKLAIWLADASQPDSLLRIGKMIKERLGIEPEMQIGFNIHNDEKARTGGNAKRKFFV